MMLKLSQINSSRTGRTSKVVQAGAPRTPGLPVTKETEHNLFIVGFLAKNAMCTTSTLK